MFETGLVNQQNKDFSAHDVTLVYAVNDACRIAVSSITTELSRGVRLLTHGNPSELLMKLIPAEI